MKRILAVIAILFFAFVCANACANPHYEEPDWYHASIEELNDGVMDDQLIPVWGRVIEQTYEGYSQHADNYTIEACGQVYACVPADDLEVGDEVTVYFADNQPVRVLYGWR